MGSFRNGTAFRDLPDLLALKEITYDEHDLLHGRYSLQHTLLWQI